MVEHAAVNRGVVGSSPTRGGIIIQSKTCKHSCLQVFVLQLFCVILIIKLELVKWKCSLCPKVILDLFWFRSEAVERE